MAKQMWVYVLASPSRELYVGVTNDLHRRWAEHQKGKAGSYTTRHRIHRLVFAEQLEGPLAAIAREKQIKSWTRLKRLELVESVNPQWQDLATKWGWQGQAHRSQP